ncbi:16108_t:CDS:2 [Rhizophagus irregularis]|nr:16108_t:CDS:2 [Rhizophagus irregularis]
MSETIDIDELTTQLEKRKILRTFYLKFAEVVKMSRFVRSSKFRDVEETPSEQSAALSTSTSKRSSFSTFADQSNKKLKTRKK